MKHENPRQEIADELAEKERELHRIVREVVTDGIWLAEFDKPMSIGLPVDDQVECLYDHVYVTQCNHSFARMYGYLQPDDLLGTRLLAFVDRLDPSNDNVLRAFIRSSYEIRNAETHEIDRNGLMRYFVNDAIGIVQKGFLKRIWGVQRDISHQRVSEQMRVHLLATVTPRERDILKLISAQLTIKEIAAALKLSVKTIDTHRTRLMKRLKIRDQAGLALLAAQLGLVAEL